MSNALIQYLSEAPSRKSPPVPKIKAGGRGKTKGATPVAKTKKATVWSSVKAKAVPKEVTLPWKKTLLLLNGVRHVLPGPEEKRSWLHGILLRPKPEKGVEAIASDGKTLAKIGVSSMKLERPIFIPAKEVEGILASCEKKIDPVLMYDPSATYPDYDSVTPARDARGSVEVKTLLRLCRNALKKLEAFRTKHKLSEMGYIGLFTFKPDFLTLDVEREDKKGKMFPVAHASMASQCSKEFEVMLDMKLVARALEAFKGKTIHVSFVNDETALRFDDDSNQHLQLVMPAF